MPFISLAQLTPHTMDWLWRGHLATGQLTLLDGDPGIGKSLLTLDLCARITTGQEFPGGAPAIPPANVLILNAEDGARELIHPRLIAARAAIERVTVWHREPGEPWLRLPGDLGQLDHALARIRPRFVVLDPLSAFLGAGLNLSSEMETRQALGPLADLAVKHQCAIQLVRHLSKGSGQRALYRGLHSIGIIAACRLAWLAGRDPRVAHRFVLAEEKTNLEAPQPSLGYSIARHASGQAVVEWSGQAAWHADDLLGGGSQRDRARRRAGEFLAMYLKDGPRRASEVTEAARRYNISKRTLRRACGDVNVDSQAVGTYQNHCFWWLLPGQELPASVRPPLTKEEKEFNDMLRSLKKPWEGGPQRGVA